MVGKFKAIREAYKAEEAALQAEAIAVQAKLEKVRVRINLFDQMIAEEEGVPTAIPETPVYRTPVAAEAKKDEIIEIHL